MIKDSILDYCREVTNLLKSSTTFGENFCYLKREFFHKFQNNVIFSTRFGAEFFEEVIDRVENGRYITPDPGQKLGFYDENFNRWLKTILAQ